MRLSSKSIGLAVIVAGFGASFVTAQSSKVEGSVDGRWDASLDNHGTTIPFHLDISGSGPTLKGTFYDGFKPYDGTTSATFQDGKLVLNIEHYLTTITATLKDGQLVGNVVTQSRGPSAEYGFQAVRHVATTVSLPPRIRLVTASALQEGVASDSWLQEVRGKSVSAESKLVPRSPTMSRKSEDKILFSRWEFCGYHGRNNRRIALISGLSNPLERIRIAVRRL
jgi:hypothetical protein